jgi:hypothetical protein
MPLALLTFLSGIAISAVAIYYSVLGLAAIFSAAALPIIVMGTILELSKLVSAWWLKANWHRAPGLLKSYMLVAVLVLMLITSMGIFGFLSKAHSDQAVPAGDAIASMQIIDEKIAIQQEYIAQARKDIEVLNTQIDRYNELGAVSRGVKVRDKQKVEREQLLSQIETSQSNLTKLREQRAPIAASVRAIEAEVGPIKYIAAFVYGDNPDVNILEKAVTWVIITIVFVFDPLAILLLLASQMSFQWVKEQKEKDEYNNWDEEWTGQDLVEVEQETEETVPEAVVEEETPKPSIDPTPSGWMYTNPHHPSTHPYLNEGFKGSKNLKPVVAKTTEKKKKESTTNQEDSAVEEAIKWAEEQRLNSLREEVKKFGYSEEKNIVRVRDRAYTRNEFEDLMGSSYVQNEEQTQSGVWSKINSKISEEEYLEKVATKRSRKKDNDNTDNAS